MNARQRNQAKLKKKAAARQGSSGGRYTPPTRARAAIVSTGFGLLALAQATPALAAEPSGGVSWAPAESQSRAQNDTGLSGVVDLAAKVVTDEPVDGWSLAVLDETGQPVFGTVCERQFPRPQDEFGLVCRWDTTRGADRRPSANRRYLVRLSTLDDGALTPAGPDRPVGLANPAAAPANVTIAYDRADRGVTLSWAPNAEPDVAHYDVEENVDGRGWVRVGTPVDTTFQRTISESGEHQYRVAAERRGPDGHALGPGKWARPQGSRQVRSGAEDRQAGQNNADRPKPNQTQQKNDRRNPNQTEQNNADRPKPNQTQQKNDRRNPNQAEQSSADRGGRSADQAGAPNGRRAQSPSPDSGPRAERGAERGAGQTAGGPQERGRTGASSGASSTPAGPPPADRSPVAFPASSATGFAALRAPAPAPRVTALTPNPVGPKAVPAPDPGFQQTLPYASRPAIDAEAPAAAPGDAAADPGADPAAELTTAAPAADPGPGARAQNHRPQGAGLLVIAGGLLATAIRPVPRRRARPTAQANATAASMPPAAPTPATPPTAPAAPTPADPPTPDAAALLERIARLEALLAERPATAPMPPPAPSTEATWYAELF